MYSQKSISFSGQIIALFLGLLVASGSTYALNEQYSEAAVCQWPAAIHITFPDTDVQCSGAYVGNGIVLTAAHCLTVYDTVNVVFGETVTSPEWAENGVDCVTHPNGYPHPEEESLYMGPDIGYCKLGTGQRVPNEPHPEPPVIPVLPPNSCESQYVREALFDSPPGATSYPDEPFGYDVNKIFGTAVGMGFSSLDCEYTTDPGCGRSSGGVGVKRYKELPFRGESINSTRQTLQFMGIQPSPNALTNGDSGGPFYFRMLDGSWRLIGIAAAISVGNLWNYNSFFQDVRQDLFPIVFYTGAPRYVRWIEESSGRDITPCHSYNAQLNRYEFDDDAFCGQSISTASTGGEGSWFLGSPPITACFSPTLYLSTECAGWVPPPFEPPLSSNNVPSDLRDATVAFALEGESGLTLDRPPIEGDAAFGELSSIYEVYGSQHDDRLSGDDSDERFLVGPGDDRVDAGKGDDEVFAGPGDDVVLSGQGNDYIEPGYGRDRVIAGPGDDIVLIKGECELEPGEVLVGGSGDDTLITPLPIAELLYRGIKVDGFENIEIVDPAMQLTTCDPDPGENEFF